mmetsp:Transcript_24861/g.73857  ORF Transcript_24861/g.73857 Transcript_24861/m.73857 type:complete len:208 (-) Transcript_24861:2536-3159(-)
MLRPPRGARRCARRRLPRPAAHAAVPLLPAPLRRAAGRAAPAAAAHARLARCVGRLVGLRAGARERRGLCGAASGVAGGAGLPRGHHVARDAPAQPRRRPHVARGLPRRVVAQAATLSINAHARAARQGRRRPPLCRARPPPRRTGLALGTAAGPRRRRLLGPRRPLGGRLPLRPPFCGAVPVPPRPRGRGRDRGRIPQVRGVHLAG